MLRSELLTWYSDVKGRECKYLATWNLKLFTHWCIRSFVVVFFAHCVVSRKRFMYHPLKDLVIWTEVCLSIISFSSEVHQNKYFPILAFIPTCIQLILNSHWPLFNRVFVKCEFDAASELLVLSLFYFNVYFHRTANENKYIELKMYFVSIRQVK